MLAITKLTELPREQYFLLRSSLSWNAIVIYHQHGTVQVVIREYTSSWYGMRELAYRSTFYSQSCVCVLRLG